VALEGDGLPNVKAFERLRAGTAFKAENGIRRFVHGRHIVPFCLPQKLHVQALDPLVFFVVFPGHVLCLLK
jgi:hypothetical protein